jgi:hypothetical protein
MQTCPKKSMSLLQHSIYSAAPWHSPVWLIDDLHSCTWARGDRRLHACIAPAASLKLVQRKLQSYEASDVLRLFQNNVVTQCGN